jgi:ribonuclease G
VSNELIIDAKSEDTRIALLQDGELVELHVEESNPGFSVGDIYLGKVTKINQGLNAAFIDIGHEKDAFLHYQDLGPNILALQKFVSKAIQGKLNSASLSGFPIDKEIPKDGNIKDVLKPGDTILVKISKEAISTKGPRVTSEITLAGRHLILIPFSDKISLSQKIQDEKERERLKSLLQSIKPKNFGVIVRTVAENKKVADLDSDLKNLVKRWRTIYKNLKGARPPKKIYSELEKPISILRDLFNESFSAIYVNDKNLAEDIKDYIAGIEPSKINIVKHYNKTTPIFEHFGIEKQIKLLFGKNVTMKSGAYLIIEHTEAMHVIDVNSGRMSKKETNQADIAFKVNMEAAKEIARQLRLRDMGGIIVVDFIDMASDEEREKLYQKMKEFMASDKAKHTILPPSKFGLIEITRQRVKPEMSIKTTETCPCCAGSGEIQSSLLIIDEIERNLRKISLQHKDKSITLAVHPFVEAYLKKGYPSLQMKWSLSLRRRLKLRPLSSLGLLEYKFYNPKEEEIFAD